MSTQARPKSRTLWYSAALELRTILGLVAVAALLSACSVESPDSAQTARGVSDAQSATLPVQLAQKPEITVAKLLKDVVGKKVAVPDSAGQSQPMEWTFEADEPKSAEILETQPNAGGMSLVIQMSTSGAPGSDDANVQLSGRLRLDYQWNGREWALQGIQNLNFRYTLGRWI
jgi:hypothetical protein